MFNGENLCFFAFVKFLNKINQIKFSGYFKLIHN